MTDKKKFFTSMIFTITAIVLLLAAIVPHLVISRYSVPSADDYLYGSLNHHLWEQSHEFIPLIKGAWDGMTTEYFAFQGTHTSVFLMALSPAVFEGSVGYGLSAYIQIGALVISVMLFSYAFFGRIFGARFTQWFFIGSALLFWMIESLFSPVDAFYWYNGALHYMFMHSCMIMMLANLVLFLAHKKKASKSIVGEITCIFFASMFAYICGGANYTTALTTGCIVFLFAIMVLLHYKSMLGFIPAGLYAVSFAVSIIAPGNATRAGLFDGYGPVKAVFKSIVHALSNELRWFDIQTVIILLFIIPVMLVIISRGKFSIKWWVPVISVVLSFGMHAAMNVPLYYAMGGGGLNRQENICKLWYQLMLTVNIFLVLAALKPLLLKALDFFREFFDTKRLIVSAGMATIYLGVMFGIVLIHAKTSDDAIHKYSSYVAYVELKTGEAQEFYSQYSKRIDTINTSGKDVVISGYTVKPYLLYFDDITQDPFDWRNSSVAEWYHKDSVIIGP